MYGWCIRFVLEEGVCRESSTDVHDEIAHRTMSRMHDIRLALESKLSMYLLRCITLFHRNMTCFSMLTLKSVYEMPMYAKEAVMPEIGK